MNFTERKSGILLHPSSLPSPYGIGDFGADARRFVDTLAQAGQTLWQILPLCPIGYGNSPYQSTSAFAGNVLLISPDDLITAGLLTEEDLGDVPTFPSDIVDYDAVRSYKLPLFKKAYARFQTEAPDNIQTSFAAFCAKQAFWLEDYALFTALKAHFAHERALGKGENDWITFSQNTDNLLSDEEKQAYFASACWNSWSSALRKRNGNTLKKWSRLLADAITEEKFYQYLFSVQWQALKAYANAKGISIIGDIPIFTAYDSADVWAQQPLFQLDSKGFPTVVSGVPPDYFCADGQLWGNPLYQWKAHKKTDYLWWTNRIRKALEDVDYLRIDHFRAFESHWEVPFGAPNAIQGEWKKGPGIDFFHTLRRLLGDLPLIAEDLGIITDEVRALREEAGFPGMRILQFAFGNDKNNAYLPHMCDKNSIMYSGTHDNDTTLGWYASATEAEKDHYRRYLNVDGQDAAWDFIRLAFASPAVFAIVPLQDVLNLDSHYRMNRPGISEGNWAFRFHWGQWHAGYTEGLYYLATLFGRYPER